MSTTSFLAGLSHPNRSGAAYGFRPKVRNLLYEFMDEFPSMQERAQRNSSDWNGAIENNLAATEGSLRADVAPEAKWILLGEAAAAEQLGSFLEHELTSYEKEMNDPNKDGQSGLSPYLYFGQISAQRVALQVLGGMKEAGAFLEELIVRKELSDNFCYYNQHYDGMHGFPAWAKASLSEHEKDERGLPVYPAITGAGPHP
jgi:deoxyribodipyrimidine photo-lyase